MVNKIALLVLLLIGVVYVSGAPRPTAEECPLGKFSKKNGKCGKCKICTGPFNEDEPECWKSCRGLVTERKTRLPISRTCEGDKFYSSKAESCIHCSLCGQNSTKEDRRKYGCHSSKDQCRGKDTQCPPDQFLNLRHGGCLHCSACSLFDDASYRHRLGCHQCDRRETQPTRASEQPHNQPTTMPRAAARVTTLKENHPTESITSPARARELNTSDGNGLSEQLYTPVAKSTIGKGGQIDEDDAIIGPIEANYQGAKSPASDTKYKYIVYVLSPVTGVLLVAVVAMAVFLLCKQKKNGFSSSSISGDSVQLDPCGRNEGQSVEHHPVIINATRSANEDDTGNAGEDGGPHVNEDDERNERNEDRVGDDYDHDGSANKHDNHHNDRDGDDDDDAHDNGHHEHGNQGRDGNPDNRHGDAVVAIAMDCDDGDGNGDIVDDKHHDDDGIPVDGRDGIENDPEEDDGHREGRCKEGVNGYQQDVDDAESDHCSKQGHNPEQDTHPPGSPPDNYHIQSDTQCATVMDAENETAEQSEYETKV